jgi:DNA-binding MarR family transcriptional regulator
MEGPMPGQEPAAHRVLTAFREVIAAVVLFNEQVAQRTGLSLTESQFIHLLALHGAMTPSQLGRHSGLSSGTVTGVLDRLEETGFIRRERHPTDRRKIVVVLNQNQVDEQLNPHFAGQAATLGTAIARFTPAQLEVVADFLDALIAPNEGG